MTVSKIYTAGACAFICLFIVTVVTGTLQSTTAEVVGYDCFINGDKYLPVYKVKYHGYYVNGLNALAFDYRYTDFSNYAIEFKHQALDTAKVLAINQFKNKEMLYPIGSILHDFMYNNDIVSQTYLTTKIGLLEYVSPVIKPFFHNTVFRGF